MSEPTKDEIEAARVTLDKRQWIIDLIHNEYDKAPSHYKVGDNWDDGSGWIADKILERFAATLPSDGLDAPCYYCGEPCDILAADPGRWPIPLCHKDEPGVVKFHHIQCVTDRLVENQTADVVQDLEVSNARLFDLVQFWKAHAQNGHAQVVKECASAIGLLHIEVIGIDGQHVIAMETMLNSLLDRAIATVRALAPASPHGSQRNVQDIEAERKQGDDLAPASSPTTEQAFEAGPDECDTDVALTKAIDAVLAEDAAILSGEAGVLDGPRSPSESASAFNSPSAEGSRHPEGRGADAEKLELDTSQAAVAGLTPDTLAFLNQVLTLCDHVSIVMLNDDATKREKSDLLGLSNKVKAAVIHSINANAQPRPTVDDTAGSSHHPRVWAASEEQVRVVATILATTPLIDQPKLPAECWHGLARLLIESANVASPAPADDGWLPTHQHLKTGGLYRVVCRGSLERDMSPVTVYENAEHHVFVRPTDEFEDGRFRPLPAPPAALSKE